MYANVIHYPSPHCPFPETCVCLSLTCQSYEDFKKGLPDVGWIHSILPSNESVDAFRGNMIKFKDKFRDSFSGFEFGQSSAGFIVGLGAVEQILCYSSSVSR